MDTVISPGPVAGEVTPPPSKSETHRALLASALAGGHVVEHPLDSADTRATARAIDGLGGRVDYAAGQASVDGFPDGRPQAPTDPIDCANSGTTLRLVTGVAALADGTSRLTGDASLQRRPNGPLLGALSALGAAVESEADDGTAPLSVTGPISGGTVSLSGSVSSQFVSSLLLAGAHAPGDVTVELTSPLRSAPYLALTIDTLEKFGVTVDRDGDRYTVAADTHLRPPTTPVTVGVDPTAASYPLAAGVLAGDGPVTVTDVGTRAEEIAPIVGVLEAFEVPLQRSQRSVTVERATPTPTTVDLGDCPDLLPTAAVLASVADGSSQLINCEHARFKETDRIRATAEALRALGVPVSEREDGLTIRGRPDGPAGGTVDSQGDHRIAMAAAVAGLTAEDDVHVRQAECIDVSYPAFFDDLARLGGRIDRSV